MPDDLSGEYAIHKYRHIKAVDGDPATTLGQLIDACNEASAEDLGWIAIVVVEDQTPTPDRQRVNVRINAQWKQAEARTAPTRLNRPPVRPPVRPSERG